jgi:D-aminoacyl-tRNA deacylase
MRAVVQRVKRAEVRVDGRVAGSIGAGLVVLLGVAREDTEPTAGDLAEKILNLRIFDDEQGRMTRSARDSGAAILVVSQFTLYGDCRKGRRPSFDRAAPPAVSKPLYESFLAALRAHGVEVRTGEFGAMMEVELVNDGPVTLLLDNEKLFWAGRTQTATRRGVGKITMIVVGPAFHRTWPPLVLLGA